MSHSKQRSRSARGHDHGDTSSPPPIVALFVVKFDQREGYKLIWSKHTSDLANKLEGVVDFKSLPSGLHNVKEDLVYFVHGNNAGISAFVNVPDDASQRNVQMLTVGALVPLRYGRLGKSWRHAGGMKELAKEHISNSERLRMLDEYWEKNRISEGEEGRGDRATDVDGDSPKLKSRWRNDHKPDGYRRPRGISDATALMGSEPALSANHPAISLPNFLHDFGPLVFPLYRTALLRKRILMVGEPPVERNCNFVYDLAILSSVSASLLSLLPVDSIPPLRLRPLFNVGVQDIPSLEVPKTQRPEPSTTSSPASSDDDFPPSWIACTTDDVLATKPQLFDVLVNLPPPPVPSFPSSTTTSATNLMHPGAQNRPAYPRIYPSTPTLSRSVPRNSVKATRRDLRRYLTLQSGLRDLPSARPVAKSRPPEQRDRTAPRPEPDADEDTSSLLSSSTISSSLSRSDEVVGATPWALIAYTSFIWWASAGEKRGGLGVEEDEEEEVGEEERDRSLLYGHDARTSSLTRRRRAGEEDEGEEEGLAGGGLEEEEDGETDMMSKETAIVGYFHRLTALMFTTVSDAMSRVDGEGVRRGDGLDSSSSSPVISTGRNDASKGLGIVDSEPRQPGQEQDESTQPEDPVAEEVVGEQVRSEDEDEDEDGADESAPLLRATQPEEDAKSEHEVADGVDDEDLHPAVPLTSTDLTQMGLDIWSQADRVFAEEFVAVWWGRRAVVQGGRIECCGVRVL